MNTRIGCDIEWDPVATFLMSPSQNYESFLEQKLAIETCQKSIDFYCDVLQYTRFTKSVIIRGHTGAGKKMYTICYIICDIKGIKCDNSCSDG